MDETDFNLLQAGWDNDTISVHRQRHFPAYMWRKDRSVMGWKSMPGGEGRQFFSYDKEKDRKVKGTEVTVRK